MVVPEGATLAVLGHNGAGKSTLLRILATLLRPHEGEVLVFGERLPQRGFAVRGRLGLLGHDPLLYRDLSGRENLQYHARLYGVSPARVEHVLEAVAMQQRADEPVRLLSRGMVQRLAVCRAVLHEPQLLLLDEPRANLDPAAAELRPGRVVGAGNRAAAHSWRRRCRQGPARPGAQWVWRSWFSPLVFVQVRYLIAAKPPERSGPSVHPPERRSRADTSPG